MGADAIDELSKRKHGERTDEVTHSLVALLEQGAEMVEVRDFDGRRYMREGRQYLDSRPSQWKSSDPQSFDAYWTPERVQRDVELLVGYYDAVRPYAEQLTEVVEQPSLDDIELFTEHGFVVNCSIFLGRVKTSVHAVVVTGVETTPDGERIVWYFDNNLSGVEEKPFGGMPAQYFTECIAAEDGIYAVRKYTRTPNIDNCTSTM